MRAIRKHYPLIVALVIFFLVLVIELLKALHKDEGHFIYALDDIYIHMATAKNFAKYGVWGVHKYGFTSATSSPLWTFLIALTYIIFGVNDFSPFILNIFLAVIIIVYLYQLLKKYTTNQIFILFTLLAVIFFTPFVSVIFSGQEHLMQLLSVILFSFISTQIFISDEDNHKNYLLLFLTSAFVTSSRYEGAALILIVAVLFFIRKKFIDSAITILGGATPIVIYGLFSLSNGGYFLPNSVILKGKTFLLLHSFRKFVMAVIKTIQKSPHICVLISLALFILATHLRKQSTILKDYIVLLIIFIGTSIAHLLFARVGSFFRYESYLIGFGLFAISIAFCDYISNISLKLLRQNFPFYFTLALLISWLSVPMLIRTLFSLKDTPQATKNIYEQQYHMGLFLRKFYQGSAVAANDIGAIDYLADIKCVDLYGLASTKVASLKNSNKYTTDQIYKICKENNVKIAILYEKWYKDYGGLPPQWIKVGEWTIQRNIVCGGVTVSFYAVDTAETDNLINNLRKFAKFLPSDVIQSGKYTQNL